MEKEKLWFIAEGDTVRWVKIFINKNISWDNGITHLVVSMNNNLNSAVRPSDVKVENVNIKNFFETKRDAQFEIIRRERFESEYE